MSAAGTLPEEGREGRCLNSKVDCFSLWFESRIFPSLVIRMIEFRGVIKKIPIASV